MSLSTVSINVVNAPATTVAFFTLVTITSKDPAAPVLRFTDNNEEVTSRGQKFLPYPFKIVLPRDDSETMPTAVLEIDNVLPEVLEDIRKLRVSPDIKIEVVSSISVDTPEQVLDYLTLISVSYDAQTITGVMAVNNILNAAFPYDDYDPVAYPGLFYA